MNIRGKVTSIVCLCAGLAILVSATWAQKVVRVRVGGGGRSYYDNSGCGAANTEKPVDPNAVVPIDPTPEEADRISELIEQLGGETMAGRDRAMSELAGYEARALGQVKLAKGHDDDEVANRCAVLEEVINSRQGELFLAARRLNLTIEELNTYLQNEDVTPLLSILKGRAQPGMVSLWARVLARLAMRTQLFPTAELCRDIEGTTGYGQALAKACRAPEAAGAASNILLLMALLPPGDPADTVEAMTQLRFLVGGGLGLEQVFSSCADFRGVYEPAALLAAREGRPDPNQPPQDGAAEVRIALALSMLQSATAEQLETAGLPAIDAMSPMLLNAWLGVLQRSGLNSVIESAMVGLLGAATDTRRVSITAGAYANVAPVADVIDIFDSVPVEAQLAMLDALWLNPREATVVQPFLSGLLGHAQPGLRLAAAQSLGQYRASSTAAALCKCALDDAATAPAALASLWRMADLLKKSQLDALSARLTTAGLLTRPLIAEVLVRAGSAEALKPLVDGWRTELARNELALAIRVLALSPRSAAGAYAASRLADAICSNVEPETFLLQYLSAGDFEMTRVLLGVSDDEGFKLLRAIALDESDGSRLAAMKALAMAGRDGDLVQDWLKRMAGEVKDPLGPMLGDALALSLDPAAEAFKKATLEQGAGASNIWYVVRGVLAGRCKSVTRAELLDVLFLTPESAANWAGYQDLVGGPLPPKAATNLATALAFGQGGNLFSQTGLALMLAGTDVDILKVIYGNVESPSARDTLQIYTTVVLGDRERARAIIEQTSIAEDGSNFVALVLARAWLGMLPEQESRRLRDGAAGNPTNLFGAVVRLEKAGHGNTGALRVLLDAFGPESIRFQRGETASLQLVDQSWGSPYMDVQGVAAAGFSPSLPAQWFGAGPISALFAQSPPDAWRDWWACRRALLEFDAASGKYKFTELP